ncbi:MAG: Mu-like prophage major head subunit gpT family protein [Burkholderiaceae bacterium]
MILNAASLAMLSQAVDVRFRSGLARTSTPWDFLAMTVSSTTGENIYPYLKEMGSIREWIGDREIQNLAKGDFKISNKPFEQTQGIDKTAIDDDTYGIYAPMFEQVGLNVTSFPADKVYETLAAGFTTLGPDGQYFFDTDHPVGAGVVSNHMGGSSDAWFIVDASQVFKPIIWQPRKAFDLVKLFNPTDPNVFFQNKLIWGVDGRAGVGYSPFWQLCFASKQTLDDAGVEAALTAMASQLGETGRPLKTKGTHIVVPPTLGETAKKIFGRDLITGGVSNTLKNRLQVIVAPELL